MTDERYKAIMADLGMPNSRSLLQALQQVAQEVSHAERAKCAEIAAPERFVYSDDEWRVRCEVRDAILDT